MGHKKKFLTTQQDSRHWLVWLIYGLAALALTAFFMPPPMGYLSVIFWKTIPFQLLIELMFACWLVLLIIDRRYRPQVDLLAVAVLIFTAAVLLTVPFSIEPAISFWSSTNRMTGVFYLLHIAVWFFVLVSTLRRRSEWNALLSVSVSAASLVAAMAAIDWLNQAGKIHTETLFRNSAYLTSYLLPHVFIALYLWTQRESSFRTKLWLSLAGLLAFTIFLPASRAGFLALVGGLAIMSLGLITVSGLSRRKKIVTYVLSFLLVGMMFGSLFALRSESGRAWLLENRNLPSFLDRLAFRGFGDDRWVLWDLAVKSIIERPMFGWGTEQFAQVADKYLDLTTAREVFAENKITRAHNQYLDVTLSYGLVGFAAYLFLLIALIRALIKLLRFARSSEEYRSVIILSSFFLSYLGYSFFTFDTPQQLMINFMLLALVSYLLRLKSKELNVQSIIQAIPIIPAIIIIIPILMVMWFGNIKPVMSALTFNEGAAAVAYSDYELAAEKFIQAVSSNNPYSFEFLLLPNLATQPFMDFGQAALAFTPGTEKLLRTLADLTAAATQRYPSNIAALLLAGDDQRLLSAVDESALDQAMVYAERYLKLAEKRYDGHMLMAELALLRGDNQAALHWLDLTENLSFKKNYHYTGYINFRRACILIRQRDFKRAAEYLAKIKGYEVETDARLLLDVARVIKPGDQLGELEPILRKSLSLFGNKPHVLAAGARIYNALGNENIVRQIMTRPALINWSQIEDGRIELEKLKTELNWK